MRPIIRIIIYVSTYSFAIIYMIVYKSTIYVTDETHQWDRLDVSSRVRTVMEKPKIIDDAHSEIRVELGGRLLQGWFYIDDKDRQEKMRHAWYFCDGFLCGQGATLKQADADAEMIRRIAQA